MRCLIVGPGRLTAIAVAVLLVCFAFVGRSEAGYLVGWDSEGLVPVPAGNDFVAMAGGGDYAVALRSDGSLVGWGANAWGRTNVPAGNDFAAIATGSSTCVALKTDGSLVSWGDDHFGDMSVPPPRQ